MQTGYRADAAQASREPQRKRILIVEDEPDIRHSLAQLIDTIGPFTIRQAHDGRDALRFLAAEPVDLLITDHRMPRMNGLDLLRMAHVMAPAVPALVVTAYWSQSLDEATRRIPGVAGLLRKPCDPAQLIAHIERALTGAPARA